MLTNKIDEKTNLNEPDMYYPAVPYYWLDDESKTDTTNLLFEVMSDYSCCAPREKIVGEMCFFDLRDVVACCKNPWEAPLTFARCFVDAGVRAFPDPNGVAVATMLDYQKFMDLVPRVIKNAFGILQENNTELLREEASVVLFG